MVLALGLCESCCLEIVCSHRHFQLSSKGRGKAIPCLGRSESVSVSSASWCPQITSLPTHPLSHQPSLFCDQGVREHQPRSEMRMRFTCSLTILSFFMSFTSVPWHLQFPAMPWKSTLHAGGVTACSFNIPSPLSTRLHKASRNSNLFHTAIRNL